MLMYLDKISFGIGSYLINLLTLGIKGSSMCGRLYLYNRYISKKNLLVNTLMFIIDMFEHNHCLNSARCWRVRVRKGNCKYYVIYEEYFFN